MAHRFKNYVLFATCITILLSLGFYIGKQNIQQVVPWGLSFVFFTLWLFSNRAKVTKRKIKRLK